MSEYSLPTDEQPVDGPASEQGEAVDATALSTGRLDAARQPTPTRDEPPAMPRDTPTEALETRRPGRA